MKKLLFILLLALCVALGGLVACADPTENNDDVETTTYTVAFEVDGERYATKKVKAGETITGTVENPSKTGFNFDYWTLNGEEVDVYTYVVNANVTFTAHFTEKPAEDTNYFNVYIQVNGNYLTEPEANTFKGRFLATLTAEEAAITRFYIKDAAATDFKNFVNDATDVDAVIGGNNPLNTFSYNPEYYNTEGDKLSDAAAGHFGSDNRKVIIMSTTDSLELAVKLYTFATTPYVAPVNLTVIVHGDTNETTVLTDTNTVIVLPEFTVGENEVFKGFATVQNGEVVIVCASTAVLKYGDVQNYVAEDATELDLYPVIEEQVYDMTVYVYLGNTDLTITETEFNTLKETFNTAHADKNIRWESVSGKNNAGFCSDAYNGGANIVVGGKAMTSPLVFSADYGKVLLGNNSLFEEDTRYVGLISGSEENELAIALYNYILGSVIVAE